MTPNLATIGLFIPLPPLLCAVLGHTLKLSLVCSPPSNKPNTTSLLPLESPTHTLDLTDIPLFKAWVKETEVLQPDGLQ